MSYVWESVVVDWVDEWRSGLSAVSTARATASG